MDNKLWESHRIILPEAREKMVSCCKDCRFFVEIEGEKETKYGCVVNLKKYRNFYQEVPRKIYLAELLKITDKEALQKILANGDPEQPACGKFLPKIIF